MNPKKNPNHKIYIDVLRNMTPEQRLNKAFELSEFSKEIFRHGLRKRFPDLSEEDFQKLYLKKLSIVSLLERLINESEIEKW
jgi:hypothetical protein